MRLLLSLLMPILASSMGCLDENGDAVDWFIALKYPDGGDYDYMDANNEKATHSKHDLSGKTGSVMETVAQVYKMKDTSTSAFVMYNDQDADGKDHDSRAHSKGVMGINGATGFWLIHSMPHWPPSSDQGFSGGLSDYKFGQSFICITFKKSAFNDIAQQMMINHPYQYDGQVGTGIGLASLDTWVNDDPKSKYLNKTINLVSAGGATFTHFAKAAAWGDDLYEDFVAPMIGQDLYCATWMNGGGNLGSYCNPKYDFTVKDVADLTPTMGSEYQYKTTQDHSKWCISDDDDGETNGYFVCIGDINRQTSQRKRGGGTLCRSTKTGWTSISDMVYDTFDCTKKSIRVSSASKQRAKSVLSGDASNATKSIPEPIWYPY